MWSIFCQFKVLMSDSKYDRVLSYVRIVNIRCSLCVLFRVRSRNFILDCRTLQGSFQMDKCLRENGKKKQNRIVKRQKRLFMKSHLPYVISL